MVFQNYALYPHLTIRENIGYPLKLRKVPAEVARDKISSAASRLGIEQVLDRMPSEISGGQQQRTAVARAMVQDPAAYLFDEPLSNLDARLRLESRRFLKQVLRETRGTAVYVTHDQTEAMALSDRVGVIKDGRLVQVAPPEELYARPASTFVAGFVGNLPMNLIEGEARVESGAWFVSNGLRVALPRGVTAEPGERLTLGLRPEDIALTAEASLAGVIEDIEPLGSERIVTVTAAGIPLIVRVIGEQILAIGQTIGIEPAPGRLHLFDAAGLRL
jgi:ABC-type sugar transport system ATPase subunit